MCLQGFPLREYRLGLVGLVLEPWENAGCEDRHGPKVHMLKLSSQDGNVRIDSGSGTVLSTASFHSV